MGEGGVEGGNAAASASGELGEPSIGDLSVAEETGGGDFQVVKSVVPEDVIGVGADGA